MHIINKFTKNFLLMFLFISVHCNSSVTMTGNRIIYPSNVNSVDIKLSNKDAFPYVIQCWLDSGDEKSTPQTGKAPFLVTPPIFKINPQTGQVARIMFTGDRKSLPQDRESVFYFNFLQIPPAQSEAEAKKNNQLLILLKNRVKVFYRPVQLSRPQDHVKKFEVNIRKRENASGYEVVLNNNNPWYASVADVVLVQNDHKISAGKSNMIEPFGQQTWTFSKEKLNINQSIKIILSIVNDQGATVSHEYSAHL